SWASPLSTAATGRKSGCALRSEALSRPSPPTGRPTTSCSMMVSSSRPATGVFIAFHGSWNRAPFPQGGYNVVFQPLADGKPTGPYVVFADGFAGANKDPGQAAHRPSGLAAGPDGALYITDDIRGRIGRVIFRGGAAVAGVEAAVTAPGAQASGASGAAQPPEGIH